MGAGQNIANYRMGGDKFSSFKCLGLRLHGNLYKLHGSIKALNGKGVPLPAGEHM